MSALHRVLNAFAPIGRGASVRGRVWLLALLLVLQGVAWTTHSATHALPAVACAAGAVTDDGGDGHCTGGACVTCHALSLFDGTPPAGQPPLAVSAPGPAAAADPALPPARRALPWAQSRAPPVPA